MMLVINVCRERLHYFEFVKPVEDILKSNGIKSRTIHCSKMKGGVDCGKIIICGTSLKDNGYLEHDFSWVRDTDKPVLGICAGMQIICLEFGGKIKRGTEIGYYRERFRDEFLGLNGGKEVYHLHNNYPTLPKGFREFTNSRIPQAIKHKDREIYGVLFHPEVRNKDLIVNFAGQG
jgi:GMP synthase-like glutamine amidotransferase